MMKEINDESDKQIFYRSRCLENMMKELMVFALSSSWWMLHRIWGNIVLTNKRKSKNWLRNNVQQKVYPRIECDSLFIEENVEKNVMIFQLNRDIKVCIYLFIVQTINRLLINWSKRTWRKWILPIKPSQGISSKIYLPQKRKMPSLICPSIQSSTLPSTTSTLLYSTDSKILIIWQD